MIKTMLRGKRERGVDQSGLAPALVLRHIKAFSAAGF
jgi:hypothetical protein